AILLGLAAPHRGAAAEAWTETIEAARNQTVHWHAWGGDDNVNRYVTWVSGEVQRRFGITLRHVKVGDISETVTLLLAEKAGGRRTGGRVDLIWLNGENFVTLKQNGLLYGPFARQLPNFELVDTEGKPTTVLDFNVPTEGFESPWGMAQIVFFADTERVESFPRSVRDLRDWLARNPGRFAYPAPPDFTGTTFLKQALLELAPESGPLYEPVSDKTFEQVSAPLWAYLQSLHPLLWREGKVFPPN
ncbi:MAG: ABC transporter substrate-binding protein, partial [Rhodospirillaceae bacterium]